MFSFVNTRLLTNNYVRNICVKYFHDVSKRSLVVTKNNLNFCSVFNERSLLVCVEKTNNGVSKRYFSNDDKNPNSNAENFYEVDEEAITGGDPEKLKKLKLVMLEVEVLRQEGNEVPSSLTTEQWKELYDAQSRSRKLKYLRFLFVSECKKKNDKLRKERKRIEREQKLQELIENSDPNHFRYGIGGNSIFLRIRDTTMMKLANNRLINAMKFGQDLIIDCSYDSFMTKQEINYCAKQLLYLFSMNRNNDEPFNIQFCSIDKNSYMMKQLHKHIPTMYESDFPINLQEKSYLDLYPKEKLVYLTPHCRNELLTYSHDDIYIIGAIVDKMNCEPLSLAKAKSEGLRMAKFPLDRYLHWGIGTKSLTLDQCVSILLDMKSTGDWNQAFKHVPKRKIITEEKLQRDIEDKEEERDSSPFYGQSYVAKHEWGNTKQKSQSVRKVKRVKNFDLRSLLSLRNKETG